jgi:hypothetical protein
MPEVLGGGYPVKPAIIKDESGTIISEPHSVLEKGKEKFRQTFVTKKRPSTEFQSDLDIWKSQQPSLLDRAKQTYKETAPEVLGGRPAQEGEKTFGEKAKEKLTEAKERIQPSTSTSTQPGLMGLMKQTITEVIPEMIGLKAIPDEPETKQAQKVDSTETSGDTRQADWDIQKLPQADSDIQKFRVTDEVRKIDMDQAGNVTQVEGTKNVSLVPVVVKDILVKPQDHTKPEDIPINEQPVWNQPLSDNYEFQGQSIPAPTHQKVTMPSPQIMTSPRGEQTQQHY